MTPPIMCLVTDRKRLGGRDAVESLLEQIAAAGRAGIDLVQIREPDLVARNLARVVTRALEVTRGTRTRVMVNERLDVALATGAAGVHLRADSVEAARVRRITPAGFLVGRSVHGAGEAADVSTRGGLDYLVLGTVFASASKPSGAPVVGLEELARAAHVSSLPVLAIGGISLDTLAGVAAAGAAGFAAIGLFSDALHGVALQAHLEHCVRDTRRLFDTSRSLV